MSIKGSLFAILCLVFPLTACGPGEILQSIFSEVTVTNYQVTARFSVNDEPATGSTIWQGRNYKSRLVTAPGMTHVVGEAFQLNYEGRNLFVLRRPQGVGSSEAFGAMIIHCPGSGPPEYKQSLECTITEGMQARPMLVEIPDLEDPASARILDYDWAESGGDCSNVCLLSIDVAITDAPVPNTIATVLPWLNSGNKWSVVGTGISKEETDPRDRRKIYNIDFIRRQ